MSHGIACRAELGKYPLRTVIKASIFSYWPRLKHSRNIVLLREVFQYATKYNPFSDVLVINEAITGKFQVKEPVIQQHIKNTRLTINKTLRNQYLQTRLQPRINHQQYQEKIEEH